MIEDYKPLNLGEYKDGERFIFKAARVGGPAVINHLGKKDILKDAVSLKAGETVNFPEDFEDET